jgi:carbon-monoxide dehydrogenase large subunit
VTPHGATAAGRYVGQSVKRREDPRLLSGRGRFVDDVQMPGLLHAAFVRSNVARGRITRLDVEAARAVPNVVAVYTGADLNPRCQQFWSSMMGPPISMGGQSVYAPGSVLAGDDVRYVGDPIAIIIATSRYIAEDAAELVEVDIEPMPPVLDIREAASGTTLVHPELASNLTSNVPAPVVPQLEEIFDTAAHVVSRTFTEARITNVPMETRGLIVQYDRFGGAMEIRSSNQGVHEVRGFAARLLGLPESRVRVVADDVGGAFGQKMMVSRDESAVIAAAFVLGGPPVKWIEDRRENLFAANQARSEFVEVSFAVAESGRILGAKVHFFEECGAYPPGGGAAAGIAMAVFTGPYTIPMVAPASTAVFTNTVSKAPFRGPWAMETIAREQMMDHVAREIGMDPLELRRVNLIEPGELPYTTATQMVYDAISPKETLEQAVAMIDVQRFRAEQAAARATGRFIGLGFSCYVEPSAIAFGVLANDVAAISMDASGKVLVAMGTGGHGHSLETTIPQIVADQLGCDIDDVVLVQGDTNAAATGPGTGGSRSAVIAGGAAHKAAALLRDKLVQIAAKLLEANSDDLEAVGGAVRVKGTPTAAVPFMQLAMTAHMAQALLPEGMEPGLEVTVRYAPPSPFTFSNAAHACIVEVDVETGIVRVLRYVVSEDCGEMINPMVVEGQIAGGVAQGIAGALYEHLPYDDHGNPLATTFLDYLVPTSVEIPAIEVGHVVTPSATLGGYKGMGEGGAIASPPAVANAVNDALAPFGVALTEFPFSPDRIVSALAARPA